MNAIRHLKPDGKVVINHAEAHVPKELIDDAYEYANVIYPPLPKNKDDLKIAQPFTIEFAGKVKFTIHYFPTSLLKERMLICGFHHIEQKSWINETPRGKKITKSKTSTMV